jgi:hypothetical protein
MKRGLYYRPNSSGYTGIRDEAGRYTKSEANDRVDPVSGVSMLHEDEAPEFSPKCCDDVARRHLKRQRDDLRAALDLALIRLGKMEPGDSRAVSNEYVAMAAAGTIHHNDEGREIIRRAIEAEPAQ